MLYYWGWFLTLFILPVDQHRVHNNTHVIFKVIDCGAVLRQVARFEDSFLEHRPHLRDLARGHLLETSSLLERTSTGSRKKCQVKQD